LKHLAYAAFAVVLAVGGAVPPTTSAAVAAETAAQSKASDLLIYHVEGRRSQRIVWLCEELGIPYTLVFKRGDVGGSFATIREKFPEMAVAPVLVYKGHAMVESGAILDFLQAEFGNGRLAPPLSSPDYMFHQQWLHFSEGSALPVLFSEGVGGRYVIGKDRQGPAKPRPEFRKGTEDLMRFIEDYISKHPYFGGETFSTADIMMHFIASLAPDPAYFSIDMSKYPNFSAWQKKVESRPGYIKAMKAALPDGQPSQCRFPSCNPPKAN
jgi:glutathione S-transferase